MILWGPAGTGRRRWRGSSRTRPATRWRASRPSQRRQRRARGARRARTSDSANTAQRTVLFIDEVHRFNKSQQDLLLPATETGQVVLIGATTENPYFEVNAALMSRIDAVAPASAVAPTTSRSLVRRGVELRSSAHHRRGARGDHVGERRRRARRADDARHGDRAGARRGVDAGRRRARARVPGARRSSLSPVARYALRPDQRVHQVGARLGPRRRALLAGHDARERRESAVPRAAPRHPGERGHRSGRSHGRWSSPTPRRERSSSSGYPRAD